ncbi:MAG: serine/threonine protein kinase [Candidatus Eremiobacteraeota bacterium]|nr:serine/threonine protein kinase [Candidatus Eremiobacteraeota bacterium]MCW5872552.1 serine/threonine protein kinase [Candidatus Eremiobacteraeota bacterium]
MKKWIGAALLCLLVEGWVWRPQTVMPEEGRLQTIPPGATYRFNAQMGMTPLQVKPLADWDRAKGSRVHLSYFGYADQAVEYAAGVVPMQLSATGLLVYNTPLWLALGCLGAAWRQRQLEQKSVRKVGGYRLHELVGRGATAEVYRASDARGRPVAVKWLHEHIGGTEEFANRFRREAEICSRLQHPGVVGVFAWGEQENRLWMSQEWIEGPSLEQSPAPPARLKELLISLCQALDYAHQAGVIHRDLKPSNILLRADGSPVIADFGLARSAHYETITKTETTLGTPTYMPPEQVTGQGSDARSDLYSLGCVTYWLWRGKLPFLGADPIQTLLAHLHDPVPPLPDEPPGWAQLIRELLAKEREQRPASARVVLERLQALAPLA